MYNTDPQLLLIDPRRLQRVLSRIEQLDALADLRSKQVAEKCFAAYTRRLRHVEYERQQANEERNTELFKTSQANITREHVTRSVSRTLQDDYAKA